MTQKDLPVWRSMLFVPVTARRFVDGAARRGADAIILDLEDAVAASEKERARTLVPEAAQIVSRGGADVVVRLNRPLRMTVRDLEAVIGPGVQAVALPKAESAQHVQLVAEIIDELEAERGIPVGTTKMLAMVETCSAFFRIAEIAKASPRLVALNLGAEDFATAAGMLPEAEGLFMPKQMCVFAARAAGIMPMGFVGTVAEFHDLDGFRETVRRSRRLGFVGASVIHPSQVADPQRGIPAERRRGRARRPGRRRLRQGAGRRGRRGHRRRQDDRRAGGRARQAAAAARGGDRRPRGEEAGRRLSDCRAAHLVRAVVTFRPAGDMMRGGADGGGDMYDNTVFVILLMLCVIIYMLPTLIAYARDIPQPPDGHRRQHHLRLDADRLVHLLPVGDAGGDQHRRARLTPPRRRPHGRDQRRVAHPGDGADRVSRQRQDHAA